MTNHYSGSCLCEACRYVITGEKPDAMFLCHCSRCRKETGSVHGANVFFKKAQIHWEQGETNLTHFHLKDTRKKRTFCKTCGSPLPWYYDTGGVVLPAGSLDDDTTLEPTAHIYYESRSSWEDKLANIKRFDELPHR